LGAELPGALAFLQQAHRQPESKKLQIYDGWDYFIHGWTCVISDVFAIEIPSGLSNLSATFARSRANQRKIMRRILVTPRSLSASEHPAIQLLRDQGWEVIFGPRGRLPEEGELLQLCRNAQDG